MFRLAPSAKSLLRVIAIAVLLAPASGAANAVDMFVGTYQPAFTTSSEGIQKLTVKKVDTNTASVSMVLANGAKSVQLPSTKATIFESTRSPAFSGKMPKLLGEWQQNGERIVLIATRRSNVLLSIEFYRKPAAGAGSAETGYLSREGAKNPAQDFKNITEQILEKAK